jgi:hypothetical protein
MTRPRTLVVCLLAGSVLLSATAQAQTLAEASAAAKLIKHEWPVSDNMVPAYDAGKVVAPAIATPSEAAAVVTPTPAAPKDALYWKTRMRTLTTQLQNDTTFKSAAIARLATLTAEQEIPRTAVERAHAKTDLTAATADASRLTAAVVTDARAIKDLELEAHRAGVPPGWLVLE